MKKVINDSVLINWIIYILIILIFSSNRRSVYVNTA